MIHFILNDRCVAADCSPGILVLDFVRKHRRLTGTKEGCKEGDCGACMVLVGEATGESVLYKPIPSCMMPVGELHGKHLVTVEGLNMPALSPAQRAIVDEGATQCGYCTPGIVVSLTGLLLDPDKGLDEEQIKYALSGNLCRCTGYRSLKNASDVLQRSLGARLSGDRVKNLVDAGALPAYFMEIPGRLQKISFVDAGPMRFSGARRIAGGTDLYVQHGEDIPVDSVDLLSAYPALKGIREAEGMFHVGALTTFEEFGADPGLLQMMPRLPRYLHLMASWQIRNRATIGGNLVNASPIADMTSLLLALDAEVVLKDGDARRNVPLQSFFLDYKVIDLNDAEIVLEVIFPGPKPDTYIHWEKVSKRTCLDIATINTGAKFRVIDGRVEDAVVSLGGVAATPRVLEKMGNFLVGRPLTVDTILEAESIAQSEFNPISDVRGSAEYRRLLARQLLFAHFIEMFPDRFSLEALCAAH
jgi:xanthine dehydrogenase small subunit